MTAKDDIVAQFKIVSLKIIKMPKIPEVLRLSYSLFRNVSNSICYFSTISSTPFIKVVLFFFYLLLMGKSWSAMAFLFYCDIAKTEE